VLLLKASVFFHDEFFYKMDNINDDYHLFLINNEAPAVFVLPGLVFCMPSSFAGERQLEL
jgi:hypothetical protein